MKAKARVYRTDWPEIIAGFKKSGMRQVDYAKKVGVDEGSLSKMLIKDRKRNEKNGTAKRVVNGTNGFVKVGGHNDTPMIELVSKGVTVRVPVDVDVMLLRSIIAACSNE